MPHVETKELLRLQQNIKQIRNICILAHVDHGKTTLADSLVASNGIISQRMAGKLRYLDNRPDEQERGITMKSSSISLHYNRSCSNEEFLINLIDSPGHIDFSSEVSTAVRLCDGAVIVVDVVEGVCPQTRACLHQTYIEHLKPVLLLNKLDRLILEKKFTPLDAYIHLAQLLEQVNAVMGNIFASDVFAKEDLTKSDGVSALEASDDSDLYFAPERGNVVFCSAIDGWAFSVKDFASVYSKKLEIPPETLEKVLWGDFYYSVKQKSAIAGAQEKAKKPMFVQFVLENIWNLYDIIAIRKDKEKLPVVAEKLGIKLTVRDLRLGDPKAQLKSVFEQWLPIDRAVLEMVIANIPSPNVISDERAERLLCPSNCDFLSYPLETQSLKEDFKNCDPLSSKVIVFISKMMPIHKSHLPQNRPKRFTEEEIQARRDIARQRILERKKAMEEQQNNSDIKAVTESMDALSTSTSEDVEQEKELNKEDEEIDQVFIAFARVFSGTLKKGMELYVLSPKHDPRNEKLSESPHVAKVVVGDLYVLMGGELENVNDVPAGNIVGIGGLEEHVIKTATLSSTIYCSSFSDLNFMATPILRVAIEAENPVEMSKLVKGLKLLNQADACVQVSLQETGEHVITTLGEVHLEKCIKDLEELYAKVKLNVSKPIVSFRETIVPEATVDMVNEAILNTEKDIRKKIVTIQTANKLCTIKILALPLPKSCVDLLEKYTDILKALSTITKVNRFPERSMNSLMQLKNSLSKSLEELNVGETLMENIDESNLIDKVWSIGPRKCGTNILLNLTDYKHPFFWEISFEISKLIEETEYDIRRDYNSSFINGFQLATVAGPLCEEPMQGVCFTILEWTVDKESSLNSKVYGPFSGQIMSTVKEGCRKAFQNQPQRLVSPMYSCNIVVNAEVLGKMYAVIGRRHGKVISGDLTEGSGNFSVTAILPVIESFNFAQEIRKQTSGLACPQLVFSHWEIIDIDPFWVPFTEEEYTHFGEKADSANRAKMYMESVRKRKGLYVEEKLVEHAEKQRTLSKNK